MGRHRRNRKRRRWVVVGILAGMVAVGLWFTQRTESPTGSKSEVPSPAPLASSDVPHPEPWLAVAPVHVRTAYAYATQRSDDLQWIPCYCGCDRLGHRNVLDCFISLETGRFNRHALRCPVCLSIVLEVEAMRRRGWSLADVRYRIDRAYARFGSATPTPSPSPQSR